METAIISAISLLIAVAGVKMLQPAVNEMTNSVFGLNLKEVKYICFLFILWLLPIVLSALMPLLISAYNQRKEELHKPNDFGKTARSAPVIFQFIISFFFIVGYMIINKQMKLVESNYQDFRLDELVYIRMEEGSDKNAEILKEELLSHPEFQSISINQQLPLAIGYHRNIWTGRPKKDENNFGIAYCIGDFDYINTFNMDLISGRNFSKQNPGDGLNCLINEKAVEYLGFDNPVDKEIIYWDEKVGKIIGVVKDFHFASIHKEVEPLIICARPDWHDLKYCIIRVNLTNSEEALSKLEEIWSKVNPGIPIQVSYFEDVYNTLYKNERTVSRIFKIFSFITIFVSCLGLFGLVAFTIGRKIKEAAIRKVFGSSDMKLFSFFTKGFIAKVIIAIAISCPVTCLLINRWLNSFAYHTSISIWNILLSIILILGISLISISLIAIRASRSNPVDTIRDD